MARPKSDDPRSETLRFRATVSERGQIEALAKAAGVGVSDFLRSCALGGSAEQVRPVAQKVAARVAVDEAKAALPGPITYEALPDMPPKNTPGLRWCPELLCQFRSAGAAKCPVHGVETKAGL